MREKIRDLRKKMKTGWKIVKKLVACKKVSSNATQELT